MAVKKIATDTTVIVRWAIVGFRELKVEDKIQCDVEGTQGPL